jgi:hypothetical protein
MDSMFDFTERCVTLAGGSHAIGRDMAVGLVTAPGHFRDVRSQAEDSAYHDSMATAPAAFAKKHALQWRGQ